MSRSDVLSSTAYQLAAKLTDAGLSENEALEWVREILAEAWEEGWFAGESDTRRAILPAHHTSDCDCETVTPNPYE